MTGTALVCGYAADRWLGDPDRLHPVAGFGQVALRLESVVYAPTRGRGAAYAAALIVAAALTGEMTARGAQRIGAGRPAALALLTWVAVGGRSLTEVATGLATEVEGGDLDAARRALPSLCGRDPEKLGARALARAALESVAENTSDAVVGALVWGALAGPAGVAGYRAVNTLDAMVGHRSERYAEFGWAAARLDDVANWPAARFSALLTALCAPLVGGSPRQTWRVCVRDGDKHPSPNAGWAEAAFAGALDVRLGGPLAYHGVVELRPEMGDGTPPGVADIRRATRLSVAVGVSAAVLCAVARAGLLAMCRRGPR